jgi:hypothetical protein
MRGAADADWVEAAALPEGEEPGGVDAFGADAVVGVGGGRRVLQAPAQVQDGPL